MSGDGSGGLHHGGRAKGVGVFHVRARLYQRRGDVGPAHVSGIDDGRRTVRLGRIDVRAPVDELLHGAKITGLNGVVQRRVGIGGLSARQSK